jgi:hypothetical protein
MMFTFIADDCADLPIEACCRTMKVSRSAFFAWRQRRSNPTPKMVDDIDLAELIVKIHDQSHGTYGAPRVTAELRLGLVRQVNHKRVERLMREHGLQGVTRRRRGKRCTRAERGPISDDLVHRQFRPDRPDRLWVQDITQHRTAEGWVYMAVVIDAWSRRVIGWSIADHLRAELVVDALEMARLRRRPDGTTVHSDHGAQGELNRSSQHLTMMEVCSGAKAAVGGQGASAGDEVTGAADSGASCGARVLASDRSGQEHRGCHWHDRGVGPRRVALVPSRWRHATREPRRTDRPILVVR